MLTATKFAAPESPATDSLALPYEARLKSRQYLRLSSGEEFGYSLPPGTFLQDGDKLVAEEGSVRRVVQIVAAAESMVEVHVDDVLHFARAAYHLGNRHVKVEIGSDARGPFLRLQPDHVLEEMLLGLGCTLVGRDAPFHPEGGAYSGHGHSNKHDSDTHLHETSVQKIHPFR